MQGQSRLSPLANAGAGDGQALLGQIPCFGESHFYSVFRNSSLHTAFEENRKGPQRSITPNPLFYRWENIQQGRITCSGSHNNSHVEAARSAPPGASVKHSFQDPSSFQTLTLKCHEWPAPTDSPSSVPLELWPLGSKATCPRSWASGQRLLCRAPTLTTTLSTRVDLGCQWPQCHLEQSLGLDHLP